jgi:glucokinase
VALADLNGTVIGKWVATLRSSRTPEVIAKLVAAGIKALKKQHKIRSEKILALAAGAPGITDVRAGIVVSAPNLSNWQSVPLRTILEKHTGIPTAIENDVNLGALGESWCGTARGVKNFVFLAIGTGIGAGIFVNGSLYHGSNWSAGEVGYLHVPGTEDTSLQLYSPGPLEGIVGGRGIESSWRTLCHERGVRIKKSRARIRATDIFELAEAGEPEARAVLAQTSRILASAIANISVLLNSSLILLGGGIGTHPVLFEATRQVLEADEFARPRLAVSSLGTDAQLMGAVWMALKSVESKILP